MRILFFTDHFRPEPSAPAAHVYERCRIWVEQGHKVTVICSAPNFPGGKVYEGYRNRPRIVEEMEKIRVVRVLTFVVENKGLLLRTLDYCSYAVSSFINAIFEKKPDVVISTSPHLFVPMAAVAYAALRRVPHVFEIRDLWPASIVSTKLMAQGRIYRVLERMELFLYRRSRRIIVLSPSFVDDLALRGVEAKKIDVVINGTNLCLFSPRPKDPGLMAEYGLKDRFVVGYLGTLGLAHGLENVLDAAEQLRDTDVSFFFVGVGATKEDLEREARSRHLLNVVFAPRQLREDMPKFWSLCDLSLIHLRNDPVFRMAVPSKIFESMAMGVPVVYVGPPSTGTGIVESCETGLAVEPDDPAALARAVMKLRSDSSLRDQFSRNSVETAPSYSREEQAEKTLASLQEAAENWR